MKYSTPSIEVVTFNSSDAPRIGMQWWAFDEASSTYVALGQNWTPPSGNALRPKCQGVEEPLLGGIVNNFACDAETISGITPFVDQTTGATIIFVSDDMKSC